MKSKLPLLISSCLAILFVVGIGLQKKTNDEYFEVGEGRTAEKSVLLSSADEDPTVLASEVVKSSKENAKDSQGTADQATLASDEAVTIEDDGAKSKQRRDFGSLARLGKAAFDINTLDELFGAQEGDHVMIPLNPPVPGVVSNNHVHDHGARSFSVALDGYDGAFFSVVRETSGEVSGHMLQNGSEFGYAISSNVDSGELEVERTVASNVLCTKVLENNHSFGLDVAPGEEANAGVQAGGEFVIPILNSKAGSANVIYLDFDGEVVENTSWLGGARIDAQPYAFEDRIDEIWANMSVDFRPFDVNVTTDRSVFNSAAVGNRCMVIFTPTKDAAPSAGGVAYLNSFGSAVNYMCWAFNAGVQSAGETGSHEVGHQLGLRHDGRNTPSEEYYSGHTHSSGVHWGPIMGATFGGDMVHWSKGEYVEANRQEDDYTLIVDDLPYRADDYGTTLLDATVISPDETKTFTRAGVIERESDVDMFKLTINKAGTIAVTATGAAAWRNLDIRLRLLDSTGAVLESNAPAGENYGAAFSRAGLQPGTYYIEVDGVGLGATGFAESGYNDYGSLGAYSITGTYPHTSIPYPPANLTATDGTSSDHVQVTWDASDDADGYILYRSRIDDAATAAVLTDFNSTSYNDTATVPDTIYYYWVEAYNVFGHSGKTAGETGYRALPISDVPTNVRATDASSSDYVRVTWDTASWADDYLIYRNTTNATAGATQIGTTAGTSFDDRTATHDVVYYYFVRSRNASGTSDYSAGDAGRRRLPPPTTPTNVSATDQTSPVYTHITWDTSPLASAYYIYRNTVDQGNGSFLGSTATTEYYDYTGLAGVTYYYYVKAGSEYGQSGDSARDAGSRQPTAPEIPQNLVVQKGLFNDYVRIDWEPTSETTHYQVYRGFTDDASASFPLPGGQNAQNAFFNDFSVEDGTTYFYFVRSVNAIGPSGLSNGDYGFTSEQSPTDDNYENNEVLGSAHDLGYREEQWLRDNQGYGISSDDDWYKVTLGPSDNQLDVILAFTASAGDLDLKVFDSAGTELGSSASDTPNEAFSYQSAGTGESFYILVSSDANAGGQYDLKWKSVDSSGPAAAAAGNLVDAAIGKSPAGLLGRDSFSPFAIGQRISNSSKSKRTRRAYFSVENEGAVAAPIVTVGSRSKRYFSVSYYKRVDGGYSNVTGAVYYANAADYEPMEESLHFVNVKPRRIKYWKKKRASLSIRSYLEQDSSVLDSARFDVTKKRKRKRRR